ncbi:MAG TPA: hypothetical protein VLX92_30780 [Kofleriaceae bacterium]|nr:hypothetical protein [Kofleriaceae bacterium]
MRKTPWWFVVIALYVSSLFLPAVTLAPHRADGAASASEVLAVAALGLRAQGLALVAALIGLGLALATSLALRDELGALHVGYLVWLGSLLALAVIASTQRASPHDDATSSR